MGAGLTKPPAGQIAGQQFDNSKVYLLTGKTLNGMAGAGASGALSIRGVQGEISVSEDCDGIVIGLEAGGGKTAYFWENGTLVAYQVLVS